MTDFQFYALAITIKLAALAALIVIHYFN